MAFEHLVGGELSEPLIAIETKNAASAQTFIDKRTKQGKDPSKAVSYEGVEFEVGGSEDNAVGLIGETVVLAQSEKEFKAAVDASKGESLGGEDRFQSSDRQCLRTAASPTSTSTSAGSSTSPKTAKSTRPGEGSCCRAAASTLSEATAVASVIPRSNQIVVDLSSELGGKEAPAGDASEAAWLAARQLFAGSLASPDSASSWKKRSTTSMKKASPRTSNRAN